MIKTKAVFISRLRARQAAYLAAIDYGYEPDQALFKSKARLHKERGEVLGYLGIWFDRNGAGYPVMEK